MFRWRLIALAGVVYLSNSAAFGGGISVTEMSAKGLGTAFASGGAAAEDASTQWFNPASMTRLERSVMVSTSLVVPIFDYTDTGSTQTLGNAALPLLPNAPGRADGGKSSIVPSIFYNHPVGESLHFGIGVNAPFGLTTDYGDDWRGRYQAVRSEITNINVNPAVAWELSEHWSVGAGQASTTSKQTSAMLSISPRSVPSQPAAPAPTGPFPARDNSTASCATKAMTSATASIWACSGSTISRLGHPRRPHPAGQCRCQRGPSDGPLDGCGRYYLVRLERSERSPNSAG